MSEADKDARIARLGLDIARFEEYRAWEASEEDDAMIERLLDAAHASDDQKRAFRNFIDNCKGGTASWRCDSETHEVMEKQAIRCQREAEKHERAARLEIASVKRRLFKARQQIVELEAAKEA